MPDLPHRKPLGTPLRLVERARYNYLGLMTDSASIYRPTVTQTDDLGHSREYALVDTVPANRWPGGGQEGMIARRMDVRMIVKLAVPYGTDVNELDEIVYEDGDTGAVHHYQILDTSDRARQHTTLITCTEYPFHDGPISHG